MRVNVESLVAEDANKPLAVATSTRPAFVFAESINNSASDLRNQVPGLRAIVRVKSGVRAREQPPARTAHQGAHIVGAAVAGNGFGPHGIWIVAADAFVGREPDDFFHVHEHSEDMIRTQRPAGPFKREVLDLLSISEVKRAVAVSPDPDIFTRTARDGRARCRSARRS